MKTGKLYVFEGPDGSGKTTMARKLESSLDAVYFAFPGVQPGSLGKHIYDLHHGLIGGGVPIPQISLQMLHVAAHIDAIENQIKPRLWAGQTVILDRYYWSTYIYGLHNGIDEKFLLSLIGLEQMVWGDIKPTAIFLMLRSQPVRPDGKVDDPAIYGRWAQLRELYIHSLGYIAAGMNKHMIINDDTIEEAFELIMGYVMHPAIKTTDLETGELRLL